MNKFKNTNLLITFIFYYKFIIVKVNIYKCNIFYSVCLFVMVFDFYFLFLETMRQIHASMYLFGVFSSFFLSFLSWQLQNCHCWQHFWFRCFILYYIFLKIFNEKLFYFFFINYCGFEEVHKRFHFFILCLSFIFSSVYLFPFFFLSFFAVKVISLQQHLEKNLL